MRIKLVVGFAMFVAIDCAVLLVACGSSSKGSSGRGLTDATGDTGSDSTAPNDAPPGQDVNLGSDSTGPSGDGGLDAAAVKGPVYANTPTTLYAFDVPTGTLTRLGDFSCTGETDAVLDIAVNRSGQMYGVSLGTFFKVDDPTTASCTVIATADSLNAAAMDAGDAGFFAGFPNALTFVPAGTLDPNDEALVGYIEDEYIRLDLTTGKETPVGSLNPNPYGESLFSSGDMVSVTGADTYLTAFAADIDSGLQIDSGDLLVQVDPVTGRPLALVGATRTSGIYGLGYWAGTGYGFSSSGQILAIGLSSASQTVLDASLPDGSSFYGAGVTTLAPTH